MLQDLAQVDIRNRKCMVLARSQWVHEERYQRRNFPRFV
jgi:hypothetical protein